MRIQKRVLFITLLVAFCSLGYELLIARTIGQITGHIVLSQAWTIGFYIAALGFGTMCSRHFIDKYNNDRKLFADIEIMLTLLGLLCVPLLLLLHISIEIYTPFDLQHWSFLIGAQVVTVAVGFFSGFEIPLLIATSASSEDNEAQIIGYHYIGSMLGAVATAFLINSLTVAQAGLVLAGLNLFVSAFLIDWNLKRSASYVGLILVFVVGAYSSLNIDSVHRKVFYFLTSPTYFAPTLPKLLDMADEKIEVERTITPYQTIDIVTKAAMRIGDSAAQNHEVNSAQTEIFRRLYINSQLQVSLGYQDVYHETFAHAGINLSGRKPKNILILGGGDGILAYELLKYEDITITLIELDPAVLHLAKTHPLLLSMNHDSLASPRVKAIATDAFTHMIRNRIQYDAIYADFPLPRDDELMRLYSREFYSLLKRSLTPDGFLILDTPGSGTSQIENRIGDSLYAAGFANVYLLGGPTRFALASQLPIDLTANATRANFSKRSIDHFQGAKKYEDQSYPISLFRPASGRD